MANFGLFRGFSEKLLEGELPTNIGSIGSVTFAFVPEALDFFSRVGGNLTLVEQEAINQLIIGLKGYNIWDKMKAIYPMVGASAAACRQNLKSSSFEGTFSGAWQFFSTGALANGSNTFFDTKIKPNNMDRNSIHFGHYTNENIQGYKNGVLFSAFLGVNSCVLRGRGVSDDIYVNSGGSPSMITANQGFVLANRITSTSDMVFNNNTKVTRASVSGVPISTQNFYLGAYNGDGVAQNFTGAEFRFATYGDGLTDQNASDYYNAVNTFQVALSRAV